MSKSYPVELVQQTVDSFTYIFHAKNEITYVVELNRATYYFNENTHHNIFDLSFFPITKAKSNDKKIGNTIRKLIRAFLYKYESPVIYICDDLDNKHFGRGKLFSKWFNNENEDDFSHDQRIIEFQDYTSVIGVISFEWDSNKDLYLDELDRRSFE